MSFTSILSFIFLQLCLIFSLVATGPYGDKGLAQAAGGSWKLLQKNIGIVSMHMQLLHNDRVIIFDRTDFGRSNLTLPNGKCRREPSETAVKVDCTAHSVEYNVLSNTFRALTVQTDVWCSSGGVSIDGSLVQTGGFSGGDRVVRVMQACTSCDWTEFPNALLGRRWYSTNQILPDGRQIVIGGRRNFNYEFYPKNAAMSSVYSLPFLLQTDDPYQENNLYPFVFLNVDGNLFIFANNRAILFNHASRAIVRTYPTIPGGEPRNYPSTGSAVLLPLKNLQSSTIEAEVLICGGAPIKSFPSAKNGNFIGALNTCGRLKITDPRPVWAMETMPLRRVMGDMIMLPNGHVLIINGASSGTAGWEFGRGPVLSPVLYHPTSPSGSRFEVQNPSTIPRMYHSSAILVRDGRVLVGGSNPHERYEFSHALFPTELSLEAFSPSYLEARFATVRPKILTPASQSKIGYNQVMRIRFSVQGALIRASTTVTLVSPSFNTHSFSMNQRLLDLGSTKLVTLANSMFDISFMSPRSRVLAPPGYYLLFVVHQEIPSGGIWVQLQ